jgi:tetratricopeptide (TPR) repeat protein
MKPSAAADEFDEDIASRLQAIKAMQANDADVSQVAETLVTGKKFRITGSPSVGLRHAQAMVDIGVRLLSLGKKDAATKVFSKAQTILSGVIVSPNVDSKLRANSLFWIGYIQATHLQLPREAQRSYLEALESDPGDEKTRAALEALRLQWGPHLKRG